MVESQLKAALREILYASLSLDDGLSTIQNLAIGAAKDSELYFDVARVIEEILLRRPGLASAKLREMSMRLSYEKDQTLPEMLMLFDTRYTSAYKRGEWEILPDVEALPNLLELLGELSQGVNTGIKLNLRPVLPFLTDEVLMTVDAIYQRAHEASISLALHETHYLTWMLSEAGIFECSEALLNRLMAISKELDMSELAFDVSLDEASVLTELGLYKESRDILEELHKAAESEEDTVRLASVTLQQAINDTRDDSVTHSNARALADKASNLVEAVLSDDSVKSDGLGLAEMVIGTNVLVNGWREAVDQAIERLENALNVFGENPDPDETQQLLLFRCLCGLGFAYAMKEGHENITKGLEFLDRAKSIVSEKSNSDTDLRVELARVNHAVGWVCLVSESDEHWARGCDTFKECIDLRKKLQDEGSIPDIALVSAKVGLALSEMRDSIRSDTSFQNSIQDTLIEYIPLFPADNRAFAEIAIATYDVVWLAIRHGTEIPTRLLRFIEDLDRMLSDARVQEDSIFIQGASLAIPYLSKSWDVLQLRTDSIIESASEISQVSILIRSLAISKKNVESVGQDVIPLVKDFVFKDEVTEDPLLAQYWIGQTCLAKTIESYYLNKDYSELATGLYKAAMELLKVEDIETPSEESATFIKVTSISLAGILRHFALALEKEYGANIDRSSYKERSTRIDDETLNILLAEDWLGLIKITKAYLEMIANSEMVQAQPYLNAVFSNMNRALKMMDSVALVDRRVLASLGSIMNKRYYLRR